MSLVNWVLKTWNLGNLECLGVVVGRGTGMSRLGDSLSRRVCGWVAGYVRGVMCGRVMCSYVLCLSAKIMAGGRKIRHVNCTHFEIQDRVNPLNCRRFVKKSKEFK